MDGVVHSESKTHLLEYVRSLWHSFGYLDIEPKCRVRNLAQDSGEYLSALHNLRSLTLNNIDFEHIRGEEFHTCFSAFRETLTHLTLDTFTTSFSTLVTFVDYFPNIISLELDPAAMRPDEGPVPSLSQPLRGKLHVHEVGNDCLELLDRFATLDLEYEGLIIDSPPGSRLRSL